MPTERRMSMIVELFFVKKRDFKYLEQRFFQVVEAACHY